MFQVTTVKVRSWSFASMDFELSCFSENTGSCEGCGGWAESGAQEGQAAGQAAGGPARAEAVGAGKEGPPAPGGGGCGGGRAGEEGPGRAGGPAQGGSGCDGGSAGEVGPRGIGKVSGGSGAVVSEEEPSCLMVEFAGVVWGEVLSS